MILLTFRPVTTDAEILQMAGHPVEIERESKNPGGESTFQIKSLTSGQRTDAFADELVES